MNYKTIDMDRINNILEKHKIVILCDENEHPRLILSSAKDVIVIDDKTDTIKKLYSLYDFSDKIINLSDNSCYGVLQNYLDTGLLSKDELIQAILH